MLKQLIYVSQAIEAFSDDDLLALLQVARDNNQTNHITGMLVYRKGVILQVLEGENDSLAALWSRIKTDSRHHNIFEIYYRSVEERDFSEWSMAFVNMSQHDLSTVSGYTHFLEEDFSLEKFHVKTGLVRNFILNMKNCDL